MSKTNNSNFDLKAFLLRTLTDPVLWYTVLIMTALMYHYRNRDTVKTDDLGYVYALGWGLYYSHMLDHVQDIRFHEEA